VVDLERWDPPPLFGLLAAASGLPVADLSGALNMGVGMIMVVPAARFDAVLADPGVREAGGFDCGNVVSGDGSVRLIRST